MGGALFVPWDSVAEGTSADLQVTVTAKGGSLKMSEPFREMARRTMFEEVDESPVTDVLFGPIESRTRAMDLARLLGLVVLAIAGAESVLSFWFGPGAAAVAVLEAGLGVVVWWKKSATAAAALLAVTLAASFVVLLGVLRGGGVAAAWALLVAQVGVWAGGRAVHCAMVFRRLSKSSERPATAGG